MSESEQKRLLRVRPPRVKITYDVETLGSSQQKELPLVVGILADLAGNAPPPADQPPPAKYKDRKFVEIDRDNFDSVLKNVSPGLRYDVTTQSHDAAVKLSGVLTFEKLEDFNPLNVANQVPEIAKLMEARGRLNDLLAKLDGNDNLEQVMKSILEATDGPKKLSEEWKTMRPVPSSLANPGAPQS